MLKSFCVTQKNEHNIDIKGYNNFKQPISTL